MTAGVGRVAAKMDTCVLFVVLLLSWVNLSYLAQYVYPRWVTLDDPFVIAFAVYGISMSLACWCYVKTVQTHPGRVPLAWRETPTPFGSDESSPMFEDRRYCAICCHFKPPRTHHCSTCRQCILKYDHHCPWVGNCIGYYNHRYFILLVTYLPVAAWVVVVSEYRTLILCAPSLTRGPLPSVPVAPSQPQWAEAACPPSGFAFVNFVLCYGITVLSAVVLAMFALQHWWLLLLNKTTVEKMQVGQVWVFRIAPPPPCDAHTTDAQPVRPWLLWQRPQRLQHLCVCGQGTKMRSHRGRNPTVTHNNATRNTTQTGGGGRSLCTSRKCRSTAAPAFPGTTATGGRKQTLTRLCLNCTVRTTSTPRRCRRQFRRCCRRPRSVAQSCIGFGF